MSAQDTVCSVSMSLPMETLVCVCVCVCFLPSSLFLSVKVYIWRKI